MEDGKGWKRYGGARSCAHEEHVGDIRCGVKWLVGQVRTSGSFDFVLSHGGWRVLHDAGSFRDAVGGDQVISKRRRLRGGSRNVTRTPGECTCPGCLRPQCWTTKNTCCPCGSAGKWKSKFRGRGNSSILGDPEPQRLAVVPLKGELLRKDLHPCLLQLRLQH